MAQAIPIEAVNAEIPESVKGVTSKDSAYLGYLDQIKKWKQTNELATSMGTPPTPEPVKDAAATKGEEFAEMRTRVGLAVEEIGSSSSSNTEVMKDKFEEQISTIAAEKDPEAKLVQMSAVLDKYGRIRSDIALPIAINALEKCPDSIHLATQFQHDTTTSFVNADHTWVTNNAVAVEQLEPKLEPIAGDRRDNLVEISGEVTGIRLFEGVRNALQKGIITKDQIIPLLETRGISISDQDFVDGAAELNVNSLDGYNLPRILARVASRMAEGDERNRLLGLTLGYTNRMIDTRPAFEQDESGYLKATEASFNVITELLGDKASWGEFIHQKKLTGLNLPQMVSEKLYKMTNDKNRNILTRDINRKIEQQHRKVLDTRT